MAAVGLRRQIRAVGVQPPSLFLGAADVNPTVMHALRRGVATRVLYESDQVGRPEAKEFRRAMATYHAAGAEGRGVDELPLKLDVADRRVTLLSMADHLQPDVGFPTNFLVEHGGFGQVQADAFVQRWGAGAAVSQAVTRSHQRDQVLKGLC